MHFLMTVRSQNIVDRKVYFQLTEGFLGNLFLRIVGVKNSKDVLNPLQVGKDYLFNYLRVFYKELV